MVIHLTLDQTRVYDKGDNAALVELWEKLRNQAEKYCRQGQDVEVVHPDGSVVEVYSPKDFDI